MIEDKTSEIQYEEWLVVDVPRVKDLPRLRGQFTGADLDLILRLRKEGKLPSAIPGPVGR